MKTSGNKVSGEKTVVFFVFIEMSSCWKDEINLK